jgi:hypothetical protein
MSYWRSSAPQRPMTSGRNNDAAWEHPGAAGIWFWIGTVCGLA